MPSPGLFIALAFLAVSQGASTVSNGAWAVSCPFDASKALLPVTCGRLKVPENPERPGRVVEIAFMVVRAPRTIDEHGPIVYLNGGPGQVSLHFFERLVAHPHIRDVVVDRDWIFLDHRGAGRSTPSLVCPSQADTRTCRDHLVGQGIDLSQYNTLRIASDLEALRKALGVRHWNLWGLSYGSRLAVISARRYPASVRSVILDAGGYPEGLERIDDARGTEVALNKLFTKCAMDVVCAAAYPQLRARFNAALPRLRQEPLMVGERRYDDTALLRFIRNWMYPRGYSTFEQRLQSLLTVMDAAARGDARTILTTQQRMRVEEGLDTRRDPPPPPQGQYSLGLNLSVFCHESAPFESMAEYERAVAGSEIRRALLQGYGTNPQCNDWPVGKADPSLKGGFYDGPQLVLTGELDASSSGSAGYEIAKQNANARQVVFRNGMHGQFPTELPTAEESEYRLCALRLVRAFVSDPQKRLDTACAETRRLRLVR